MTPDFRVAADEWGVVRLFAIELSEKEVAPFTAVGLQRPGEPPDWPLRDALGAAHLDPGRVEVFPVGDIAALGLATYLIEGLGLPESEIAAERAEIDAVRGHVLVVTSQALGGVAQTLEPKPPLRYIGTYREAPMTPAVGKIASTSSQGRLAKRADPVVHVEKSPLMTTLIVLAAIVLGAGLVVAMALGMG